MAEERIVFDFTSDELWEAFNEGFSNDLYKKYEELRGNGIKKYSPVEKNGKVIVSFVTGRDVEYDCIYLKKEINNFITTIKTANTIDLQGCYLSNFDITQIKNYRYHAIDSFKANYSFWDGDTSFRATRFGEGNVNFRHSIFGKGKKIFLVFFSQMEM